MKGWSGNLLRIDLTRRKYVVQGIDPNILASYVGGRGLAIKILWEELEPGTDSLSPKNKLVLAVGPVTAYPGPNTGKLVIASKSPLTGGYGDGNIGSWASVHMRRANLDAIVIEGKAEKPIYLYIENDKVQFMDASDIWGLDTFEAEDRLRKIYGNNAGYLLIGQAGENLVKFATVIAQKGRSGGRPGMGAVMGSKMIKAIVIKGTRPLPPAADPALSKIGIDAIVATKSKPGYPFWLRQGTTATVEWAQEASVLPTYNYTEGQFDDFSKIGGFMVEKSKVLTRSCPNCVMPCGHVVKDLEAQLSELDYENIAMLGSNIGMDSLDKAAYLNRLADMFGMDTISLGGTLSWAMEATEKGLLKGDNGLEWGDVKAAARAVAEIANRSSELGQLLAEGSRIAAQRIGHDSWKFSMSVKGLEVSAYDCHAAPGMALAFGTSPIGASHKDSWVISWEVQTGRDSYSPEKAAKVIELQRIRGGWFESMVGCRFPWVEVGLELDWYSKLFKAATGTDLNLITLADRIYTLIRAFWIREYGGWSKEYDYPPRKWFEQPLSKGPLRGAKLRLDAYDSMLKEYYRQRGWDENGVPTISTLKSLGLEFTIPTLNKYVKLS
ncbi:MAG: aldehyde ferredoxin oxidoreductase family protein [Thermocladium sp.]